MIPLIDQKQDALGEQLLPEPSPRFAKNQR